MTDGIGSIVAYLKSSIIQNRAVSQGKLTNMR